MNIKYLAGFPNIQFVVGEVTWTKFAQGGTNLINSMSVGEVN